MLLEKPKHNSLKMAPTLFSMDWKPNLDLDLYLKKVLNRYCYGISIIYLYFHIFVDTSVRKLLHISITFKQSFILCGPVKLKILKISKFFTSSFMFNLWCSICQENCLLSFSRHQKPLTNRMNMNNCHLDWLEWDSFDLDIWWYWIVLCT